MTTIGNAINPTRSPQSQMVVQNPPGGFFLPKGAGQLVLIAADLNDGNVATLLDSGGNTVVTVHTQMPFNDRAGWFVTLPTGGRYTVTTTMPPASVTVYFTPQD